MWTRKQQKAGEIFFAGEDFSKLKQPSGKLNVGCLIILGAVIALGIWGTVIIILNIK